MFEIFKSPTFGYYFSFILGFAIVTLFQPLCTGKECEIHKAPLLDDMKKTTYKIGSKCYQFRAEIQSCPADGHGVIEAFQRKISAV
jgi:hypothetical protein